jgi:hypothetical protein
MEHPGECPQRQSADLEREKNQSWTSGVGPPVILLPEGKGQGFGGKAIRNVQMLHPLKEGLFQVRAVFYPPPIKPMNIKIEVKQGT